MVDGCGLVLLFLECGAPIVSDEADIIRSEMCRLRFFYFFRVTNCSSVLKALCCSGDILSPFLTIFISVFEIHVSFKYAQYNSVQKNRKMYETTYVKTNIRLTASSAMNGILSTYVRTDSMNKKLSRLIISLTNKIIHY